MSTQRENETARNAQLTADQWETAKSPRDVDFGGLESAIASQYGACCASHDLPCWKHYQEGHR